MGSKILTTNTAIDYTPVDASLVNLTELILRDIIGNSFAGGLAKVRNLLILVQYRHHVTFSTIWIQLMCKHNIYNEIIPRD